MRSRCFRRRRARTTARSSDSASSSTATAIGSRQYPAAAGLLLALLVAIKLGVTAWDCSVFRQQQYDAAHHVLRARSGGLKVSAMAYDGPLYYLPALLYGAVAEEARPILRAGNKAKNAGALRAAKLAEKRRLRARLDFLRLTNLVYVGTFYLVWIYGVLPALLKDRCRRLLAALLILCLPGYQKLAMMAHPDNLHLCLATLCFWCWTRLPAVAARRQDAGEALRSRADLRLALVTGISGLTRPFAAATVATFTVANLSASWLGRRSLAAAARRGLLLLAVTATLAGSWYVWRGVHTGAWGARYPGQYMAKFDRRQFDYGHYLTTFYFPELLRDPNRRINRLDPLHDATDRFVADNRYANSFFTTLYSETWGDHWLYVSGPKGSDRKVGAKRVLFVLALPLVPLLALRFLRAAGGVFARIRALGTAAALDPSVMLLAVFSSGAALFLWWQMGGALTPGKQSSIKFIYNAYLYAPAVTFCFLPRMAESRFRIWLLYLLALFAAALPVAVFWPRSW